MRNPWRTAALKYGISLAVCLGLAYVAVSARVDLANPDGTTLVEWYRILCDAFTIPGLLLVMFGILMTLSNEGALDGVAYVTTNALRMLIPGGGANMLRYKEYIEQRREKRVKGYGFLYVVGFGFLAVAAVFYVLFYTLY